ncbi:nickel-dependent hydrogenase large subunit [Venenivibrio stagnispumantis]|uniref:Ni,Fe-hydrogenase I large subunit n=1 Tax=Venenivibrio stagnispumantis TaxID=407998 RepID=A0AA46AF02_9AQUI|nr:nickel-dependent hydrogenase large subunit [Venenivibrio stagnispumantis]MCW4573089.1 nickel-dependent hydrogenase large subunit [Venenivibrio stagnispumantis]SMP15380.1 Ni,Fe-hydrogenase I large subunit [Venenivibrio stagnispumantis]
MKIKKEILNRVEGEIELKLMWEDNTIKDALIIAPNFRGFEFILRNKPVLDALVISPRVCGICGHAHLIATVNAIEDIYNKNGYEIKITEKAKLIRNITLAAEIIQNHIRWFYLFLIPDFLYFNENMKIYYEPIKGLQWQKGLKASSEIVKVISIFGGQWPHTSYAVPGGVVSDPITTDIISAISIVDYLIKFFEDEILGIDAEKYLATSSFEELINILKDGDLKRFIEMTFSLNMENIGTAYKRFITLGDILPCIKKGVIKKKKVKFDLNKIKEIDSYSYLTKNFDIKLDEKRYTWAKGVHYDKLPMETGPLARRILNEDNLFLDMLNKFSDSFLVRVLARLDEIIKLLFSMKNWLLSINLKESSYIKPQMDIKKLSGQGTGITEAARGSLIHQVVIKNGNIEEYNIITPTVWNLTSRDEKYPSPAEKAIIGLDSNIKAHMVLRSFDICSVCTTH